MDSFPAKVIVGQASVEAIRRAPLDGEGRPLPIPVRVRLARRSQIGFLASMADRECEVSLVVTQPEADSTNLTSLLIIVGGWPNPPPEVVVHRVRMHRRRRGDLQIRLPDPRKLGLPHPYPLGTWQGTVSVPTEAKPGQPEAIIALQGVSHKARRVESALYLPKDFHDDAPPTLVLP